MTHPHPERRKKKKLVEGVGINDASFPISYVNEHGERRLVESYRCWKGMLHRCYSGQFTAYADCSVCDEWLRYTVFHDWYISQPKNIGDHLDKDIIFPGNRVYCPAACAFVPHFVNTFIVDRAAYRGRYLIGACWHKEDRKFVGRCNNPITKKLENLGRFDTEAEAHQAWKKRKHELAIELSEKVADSRAASALVARYPWAGSC